MPNFLFNYYKPYYLDSIVLLPDTDIVIDKQEHLCKMSTILLK